MLSGEETVSRNDGDVSVLPSVECKQPWKTKGVDEYLTIAKVCGNKLKYRHHIQRKMAEKAINDILLEADMGTLHRWSVQINCPHQNWDLLSPGILDHSCTMNANTRNPEHRPTMCSHIPKICITTLMQLPFNSNFSDL
jgi:hypothetical protein